MSICICLIYYYFYFGKVYCKIRRLYYFNVVCFAWIAMIGTEAFLILTTATTIQRIEYHGVKKKKNGIALLQPHC